MNEQQCYARMIASRRSTCEAIIGANVSTINTVRSLGWQDMAESSIHSINLELAEYPTDIYTFLTMFRRK